LKLNPEKLTCEQPSVTTQYNGNKMAWWRWQTIVANPNGKNKCWGEVVVYVLIYKEEKTLIKNMGEAPRVDEEEETLRGFWI